MSTTRREKAKFIGDSPAPLAQARLENRPMPSLERTEHSEDDNQRLVRDLSAICL